MVVGIVSPGAMGSAVARSLAAGGSRLVVTLEGRSDRTRGLAAGAHAEVLPTLDDVVEIADVVLSIVPPAASRPAAAAIADAAARRSATPLVADLNAIAPSTARAVAAELGRAGLDAVDGSISGPPPREQAETRVYLSGGRAAEVAALGGPGIVWRVVGDDVGLASAVKMSTASVYKGSVALFAQALSAAHANGVLDAVVEDLRRSRPDLVDGASPQLQSAASKAGRYVGEMEEIAAAQEAAGLTPALFQAMADVFRALSRSELARGAPEQVDPARTLDDVVSSLRSPRRT